MSDRGDDDGDAETVPLPVLTVFALVLVELVCRFSEGVRDSVVAWSATAPTGIDGSIIACGSSDFADGRGSNVGGAVADIANSSEEVDRSICDGLGVPCVVNCSRGSCCSLVGLFNRDVITAVGGIAVPCSANADGIDSYAIGGTAAAFSAIADGTGRSVFTGVGFNAAIAVNSCETRFAFLLSVLG
jgi:hypothetical protein